MRPNPFELTYNALFGMVANNASMRVLVLPRNFVSYAGLKDTQPYKDNLTPADVPELALISSSVSAALHNTSSTCRFIRRYNWLITTGKMHLTGALYDVEWQLMRAMVNWRSTLGGLQWPEGYAFIKRVDALDGNELYDNRGQYRGLKGWSALWGCEVEMHFRTRDLE